MVVVGNVELVILSVEEGVPFRDTGDIRYKGKGTCKQEFSLIGIIERCKIGSTAVPGA